MKTCSRLVLISGLTIWFILLIRSQIPEKVDLSICEVRNEAGMKSYSVTHMLYAKVASLPKISEDFPAPCLIHRTSKRPDTFERMSSSDIQRFVRSWQLKTSPFCNTILWHDSAGTELIRVLEPHLLPEYMWLKTGTERGDVVRLVALYHFGGIYADLDISIERELANWTFGEKNVGMIVAMEYCKNNTRYHKTDYGVIQFAFAAVPHHRVVRRALDMIEDNVYRERTTGDVYYKNYGYNAQIMRRTGPVVLSDAIKEELDKHNLTWRNVCEVFRPVMIPDTDILILPKRGFNAPKRYLTEYSVLRHFYHSNWAVRSRRAWYVPN